MNKIFELMPSLKRSTFSEQMDALIRMCIAHVLNGGEFTSLYETAEAYLRSI